MFMSLWPSSINICKQGRQMLFTFLTIVTRWSRFTSNFYAIIGQNLTWVHTENLCRIFRLVRFDSRSWQSFVSTCDVFNCLFPLDVQNKIQLLSRVFCYSWLVCLLYFWLRNAQLVKVGWHRFCFSPCWMRKRIIKAQAILALLDSLQELHLEIW